MSYSPWIQPHAKLTDTGEITAFLYAGKSWQIYRDALEQRVILASPQLMELWQRRGFTEGAEVRSAKKGGGSAYRYLVSPPRYALAPLHKGDTVRDYNSAWAIAQAIVRARGLDGRSDLAGGVFAAFLRVVLPVPSSCGPMPRGGLPPAGPAGFGPLPDSAPPAPPGLGPGRRPGSMSSRDEELFIRWLTRGAISRPVKLSRLSQLVTWLSREQLSRVLGCLGIEAERERPSSPRGGDAPEMGRPDPGRLFFQPREEPRPKGRKKRARGPDKSGRFLLPGRRELEAFLNEHVVEVLAEPEKYKKMGIDNPSGIILYGPPGCGKTYAADQLVKHLGLPSFFVNSGTVASPYIHDSSKKISAIFDKAISQAPSVLIIDEMEAYMGHRSSAGSQQHQVEEVAEFLRRIPEAIDKKVVIIAMTNLLEYIDTALLRQGRFDHKIKMDLPDKTDVLAALSGILAKRPAEEGLDLNPIADQLVKRPLSDCSYVVREASRLAVRRGQETLTQAHLLEALKRLPPAKMKPSIGF